jgi:DNA-binding Lrp family transcriptional regulator
MKTDSEVTYRRGDECIQEAEEARATPNAIHGQCPMDVLRYRPVGLPAEPCDVIYPLNVVGHQDDVRLLGCDISPDLVLWGAGSDRSMTLAVVTRCPARSGFADNDVTAIMLYIRAILFIVGQRSRLDRNKEGRRQMAETNTQRKSLIEVDRKILRALLEQDATLSTTRLAARIGLPRSTVERRRKYLENNVVTSYYYLDVRKFGYRRIDFLIETGSGFTKRIAKQLMKFREVIAVSQTIGEHTIDLIAELIVKDNSDILVLSEKVKGMPGVKDVIWTEVVEEDRKRKPIPDYIIDQF